MTAIEFSLLAVTVSFTGLVVWVYWPSRRTEIESYGSIPLDDDGSRRQFEEDRA
jgi:cbb3-type cytochrome oxidase subunit 3